MKQNANANAFGKIILSFPIFINFFFFLGEPKILEYKNLKLPN